MAADILGHVDLPGGTVYLYDWMSADVLAGRNLVLIRGGVVRWAALPPEGGADFFTQVRFEGDTLAAQSWSGFCVILDPENGKIVSKEFTK